MTSHPGTWKSLAPAETTTTISGGMLRPGRPVPSANPSALRKPAFQPASEPSGYFDHALVAIQPDYVLSSFQHRLASRASAEVFFHRHAQPGIQIAFDVIRDLLPHLLAIDYHGLVPFSKGRRLNQPCSHPPASRSRNMRRARSNRVFTEATEIPSASAVS